MAKWLLGALAFYYALSALVMFFSPQYWYDATPGVAMMGPFNLHFVRDVGLAFGASSFALCWSLAGAGYRVALMGLVWPGLHALFHIQIWLARGMPLDDVAAVNLFAIQLPVWLGLFAAWPRSSHITSVQGVLK